MSFSNTMSFPDFVTKVPGDYSILFEYMFDKLPLLIVIGTLFCYVSYPFYSKCRRQKKPRILAPLDEAAIHKFINGESQYVMVDQEQINTFPSQDLILDKTTCQTQTVGQVVQESKLGEIVQESRVAKTTLQDSIQNIPIADAKNVTATINLVKECSNNYRPLFLVEESKYDQVQTNQTIQSNDFPGQKTQDLATRDLFTNISRDDTIVTTQVELKQELITNDPPIKYHPFIDLKTLEVALIYNETSTSISELFRASYLNLVVRKQTLSLHQGSGPLSFPIREILDNMKLSPQDENLVLLTTHAMSAILTFQTNDCQNHNGDTRVEQRILTFAIPYNLNQPFDQDEFPGSPDLYAKMIKSPDQYRPTQIFLSYLDDQTNKVKKIDMTQKLKNFSWNLFCVASEFRPHVWNWLSKYSNHQPANIFLTQGFGPHQKFAHFDVGPKMNGIKPSWIQVDKVVGKK